MYTEPKQTPINIRPNIVFLDGNTINNGDLDWAPLERLGALTVYDRTSGEEIVERAKEADVVIINKTPLSDATLQKLTRLKLICVAATGFDVVDIKAARALNIPVCNCAAYGTMGVAQMVVAHLLNVTNRVDHYAEACRKGEWKASKDFCFWHSPLRELDGQSIAIVGFGNIGRKVSEMLRPFGMKLFAVTSKEQRDLPADVTKIGLEAAFEQCDVVSLNCPLTSENKEFVNRGLLQHCNPNLILINTARGKLVNSTDVAEALKENRLGAYCTDVLEEEPPRGDQPLFSAPRCYVTPHIAWATTEARRRIINILAENIEGFLHGTPVNQVN